MLYLTYWCRRSESNRHGGCPQRFLRPSRLPFRHFGIKPILYLKPQDRYPSARSRKLSILLFVTASIRKKGDAAAPVSLSPAARFDGRQEIRDSRVE